MSVGVLIYSTISTRKRIIPPPPPSDKPKMRLKVEKDSDSSSSVRTESDDGNDQVKKEVKRNFLKDNKNLNHNIITVRKVDKVYKDPTLLNLDDLSKKHGFSRSQIIKYFNLFKTLCKLTVVAEDSYEFRGVNLKTFRYLQIYGY